jgi:nicotinamidase-related amidase
MTTLKDRPATALLVIDAQNGVINHGYGPDRIVANIATLVDHAHDRNVPVV